MDDLQIDKPPRVVVIEALRGLAALGVAWFHIAGEKGLSWWNPGRFGHLGVPIFFCISGFILPYSMHVGRFCWPRDGGRFVAKRILRVDPPYFMTILICLVVEYLSTHAPNYRGAPMDYSVADIIGHVGYMNSILEYRWVNVVFWTLAIEFQFYLFVACAYPVFVSGNSLVRLIAFSGMLFASRFSSDVYVMHYFPVFVIGISSFQRFCKITSAIEWVCVIAIAACAGSKIPGIVSALTGLLIVLWPVTTIPPAFLNYLGSISYSLYLIHSPIGVRFRRLGMRAVGGSPPGQLLVQLASLAVSILVAHWMWKLIERPSQVWASRVRYTPCPSQDPPTILEN